MLHHTSITTANASAAHGIPNLSNLEGDSQVIGTLTAIASAYGTVSSVLALPETGTGPVYLVHFADTSSALLASSKLRCPLFGYSTLIVPVHKPASPSAILPTFQAAS